jgi:hypothetical protein
MNREFRQSARRLYSILGVSTRVSTDILMLVGLVHIKTRLTERNAISEKGKHKILIA